MDFCLVSMLTEGILLRLQYFFGVFFFSEMNEVSFGSKIERRL